jgi:ubiquitin-conjugating enzyme E2 O
MLITLALGYLTPLVLNFEALFLSRRKQYVPFFRNNRVELNEVMLRVPTLIAFVLHLRLLQLVWYGRKPDHQSKAETFSIAKRKALQICLSLYFLGGILAGIIHIINVHTRRESPVVVRISQEPATIWEDLVSYAGLILDGFLLPQIIFNRLSGSRVQAISPWFYIGGTLIRAMPHVYDLSRAQNYIPSLRSSYIYANSHDDLFSAAWDVIIPLGAALLALVLFLQQRLGGASLISLQGSRLGSYEMVSTI